MSSKSTPTLIFIPGSWHLPSCYDRIIAPLETNHGIRCIRVTLPSTQNNPNATFKDDIDAACSVITSEITTGNNIIVIAHSYGGMVGNSAVKEFTTRGTDGTGCVKALVLIASGFTITGLHFMAPFFDIPPPFFRVDKESGYAALVANPRDFFYHDLEQEDAKYWVNQLTTQSLKSLSEGGEHAYAGWMDVPVWYIGTVEDKGLPVIVQRVQVGTAKALGAKVEHRELQSSHSPFLSMPREVAEILLDAVEDVCGSRGRTTEERSSLEGGGVKGVIVSERNIIVPGAKLYAPGTWLRYELPLLMGRMIGWGLQGSWQPEGFGRSREIGVCAVESSTISVHRRIMH